MIIVAVVVDVVALLGPACVCVFLDFLVLVLFAFPFFSHFAFFVFLRSLREYCAGGILLQRSR